MRKTVLAGLFLLLPSSLLAASRDGIWTDVSEQEIAGRGVGQRVIIPARFRTLSLNANAFHDLVRDAPREFTPGSRFLAPTITLPLPDGTFGRFAVELSPIVDDALAAKLPGVQTWAGT